ncbi:MAG: NAD(P)/FAD-dependent oxidoreductase [Paracoccaceae bacterium]
MRQVLIIGGGVAGLSAAAHLAPHTAVTLVEAEPNLGYHASGRSAAAFIADYGNATVRDLNRASLPHLQDIPNAMARRVMMMVAKTGEEAQLAHEAPDLGMEPISLDTALGHFPILNPDVITAAAARDDAYDIDTGQIMAHFERTARAAGAVIHTRAPVTALRYDGQWQITAGPHQITADVVVNAAGAWADVLAQLAGVRPIGVQPYRRSMARVAAPAGQNVHEWAFIDGVKEQFYAKPDAGALLVSPADETPVAPHDAWASDLVLAEGIAAYEAMVTAPVTRMLANWAGLRSFVPDRSLVIGPDPQAPGFVWLAGQGGYGFQTAFGAACLLRDLMLGHTPDLPAQTVQALSPARLIPSAPFG